MERLLATGIALLLAACQSGIYVRDGVTDGDTFFLAPVAHSSDDPVIASWVRYSLIRSSCQLQFESPNPARVSRYDCELKARRHLVDAWLESRWRDSAEDTAYLDTLATVSAAGFLEEYTAHYLGKRGWRLPADIDLRAFAGWRRIHLRSHRPETRLIGYWGYRNPVDGEL